MDFAQYIQVAAVMAPPIIFSIILHEVAHGWVAEKFGDTTARSMGRLTLNPLPHIDLMGTILLPLFLILIGSKFLFGWAKPVPVNFRNLRNPKHDMIYVAGAGPATNLILALIFTLIYTVLVLSSPSLKVVFHIFISTLKIPSWGDHSAVSFLATPLVLMAGTGVVINILLMLFNLIPVPPLDGGRIMVGILPQKKAVALAKVEPYGMLILVLIIMSGILNFTIWPIFDRMIDFLL
ncbi:MAG: site-2 protease family protein [Nitrospirae bacterium CG_4_9_14_3_um_filter_53_35]|nr:MAG: site-2 protease family protein [Nitrospirae bacterium CG2_30_53_67]PIS38333.1 MAG: site-2 protease family protein [Nitrospirae bacterium CG08_land_8_20_14_0_20_52_24]PIW85204.1 MAG: site-2 protease family protein [Nitrospirae bacterium CG_4_8_14_3_um_filter_50_41]PIX84526.1 MAG: site-2 protease family protein [Nitrospirae bacterium CG_4_10_14_3_um_filter_53_41]PJA76767.1 MAG: site-2 protease family protein [Nitrospirae bacterium CG_4_9_14_3_um_filter_53_35]